MTFPVTLLWLIPTLPLAAAAFGTMLRRDQAKQASILAIGALGFSCLLSVWALVSAIGAEPGSRLTSSFVWFEGGSTAVQLGWVLDPLSATMAAMVSFVGVLIFVFSSEYMEADHRSGRFFTFLSLFAAGMLGLVLSNSLLLLFMCWEVIGLASFLLIGFWHHKPSAVAAAKKAFLTTRIGDVGFLLGLVWLQNRTGTTLFFADGGGCLEARMLDTLAAPVLGGVMATSTVIGLLLFCGAAGKSGQFPLHVWLPDAMEGPTPVSALIHAATLVAAGVFLMARVFPLLVIDQNLQHVSLHVLSVITVVGSITALLGAVVAMGQSDIKRVLAFSTVSQLGYMMVAVGVGAWPAAIFHLLTHAFFKALLFLGAGSVIHAAHHEQDIRRLGGLRKPMKATFATFAIGTCALTGVPFFFSGFWSKEAILHGVHEWHVSSLPFVLLLIGVACTAFYMTRLVAETFFGRNRGEAHGEEAQGHAIHENGLRMTLPLGLLAFATIGLSVIATPAWPWLVAFLKGEPANFVPHALFEGGALMWASIAIVGSGISAGWFVYGRKPRVNADDQDPLEKKTPTAYGVLRDRFRLDELYDRTFGRAMAGAVAAFIALDRWVIGGFVKSISGLLQFSGGAKQELEEQVVDGGARNLGDSFAGIASRYSLSQDGRIQKVLRIAVLGFVVIAATIVWGGAQ